MEFTSRQAAVIAFLFGYTALGLGALYFIKERRYCNSDLMFTLNTEYLDSKNDYDEDSKNEDNEFLEQPESIFSQRYCAGGVHGLLSSISVFICGYAMLIYRLFYDVKTQIVKKMHAIIHSIALSLFGIGIIYLYLDDSSSEFDKYYYHKIIGKFAAWMYIIQFLVGSLIFFVQTNNLFRIKFAPFHDLFGIWVFVIMIGCCMSGKELAYMDYRQMEIYGHSISLMGSIFFIFVVVINPVFEWNLVGYL